MQNVAALLMVVVVFGAGSLGNCQGSDNSESATLVFRPGEVGVRVVPSPRTDEAKRRLAQGALVVQARELRILPPTPDGSLVECTGDVRIEGEQFSAEAEKLLIFGDGKRLEFTNLRATKRNAAGTVCDQFIAPRLVFFNTEHVTKPKTTSPPLAPCTTPQPPIEP